MCRAPRSATIETILPSMSERSWPFDDDGDDEDVHDRDGLDFPTDDLWEAFDEDLGPLGLGRPDQSNRTWRHPSELGKIPDSDSSPIEPIDEDQVRPPILALYGNNSVRGPEPSRRLLAGTFAAGVCCIAVGSVISLAGVLRIHMNTGTPPSSASLASQMSHTQAAMPELVTIRYAASSLNRLDDTVEPGETVEPVETEGPTDTVELGIRRGTSAELAGRSSRPADVIDAGGYVIDADGTIAAILRHRPSGRVEILTQMRSDDAHLVGWDEALGLAVFQTDNATHFRSAPDLNAAIDGELLDSLSTPTTVVDGIVMVECPDSTPMILGAPVVSTDGRLFGVVAEPKMPDSAATSLARRSPTAKVTSERYVIPYSMILKASERLLAEQTSQGAG